MGLFNAFREIRMDREALRRRRSFANGISKGKIAGIVTFRLSRSPLFTFTPKSRNFTIAKERGCFVWPGIRQCKLPKMAILSHPGAKIFHRQATRQSGMSGHMF